MNADTIVQYRLLINRWMSMTWTHKIQEKQAEIYLEKNKNLEKWMTRLTVATTTSVFSVILTNFGAELILEILTGILAAMSTYFTLRYKDGALDQKAKANKEYAAKCRSMREAYASLMADVKSGRFATIEEIVKRRDDLEHTEQILFENTIAPHTTEEAVIRARDALKINKESTTEQDEINQILPDNLKIEE